MRGERRYGRWDLMLTLFGKSARAPSTNRLSGRAEMAAEIEPNQRHKTKEHACDMLLPLTDFCEWCEIFQPIERFHSRDQRLWKFMGIKESVYIRKEINSERIGFEHQHGCRFVVLEHQYGRRDERHVKTLYKKVYHCKLSKKKRCLSISLFCAFKSDAGFWPVRASRTLAANSIPASSKPVALIFKNSSIP